MNNIQFLYVIYLSFFYYYLYVLENYDDLFEDPSLMSSWVIHSYFIQSCIDNSHREDIDNTYPTTQLQARGIIALGIAVHKYSICVCKIVLTYYVPI